MKNREIEAAWNYHNGTKHSYQSIRTNRHYLDWENQPMPFKIYSNLEPIPLPQHLSSSGMPALEAISLSAIARSERSPADSQTLAEMLFLSAGITRRRSYPGGEILFRAAACTGALYHIDLYLVCGDLEGLDAGVYHFSPQDFALRRLRAGDYRSVLVNASGEEPSIAQRAVHDRQRVDVLAQCLEIPGPRLSALLLGQRHDSRQSSGGRRGAQNSGESSPRFRRCGGERAFGFGQRREAPLSIVALGSVSTPASIGLRLSSRWSSKPCRYRRSEVDYPAMREMHEASSLESEEEVVAWREGAKKRKAKG